MVLGYGYGNARSQVADYGITGIRECSVLPIKAGCVRFAFARTILAKPGTKIFAHVELRSCHKNTRRHRNKSGGKRLEFYTKQTAYKSVNVNIA